MANYTFPIVHSLLGVTERMVKEESLTILETGCTHTLRLCLTLLFCYSLNSHLFVWSLHLLRRAELLIVPEN